METPTKQKRFTWSHGAVVRGPRDRKRLSLVFTGGHFGEGALHVLDTLRKRGLKGAFFFTGDYTGDPGHHESITVAVRDGHLVGPHSHKHLLYCPWDDREKTLVTRDEFEADLQENVDTLAGLGVPRSTMRWWIPPYEWYNSEISRWAYELGYPLFNFSPGTLSHTDYTEDDAKNYRSNATILESIRAFEAKESDGLKGFLLLTHVGAGPRRTEKFFEILPALIDELAAKGYSFCRLDEMLVGAVEERDWGS